MREIIFRGRRIDNSEFVYGYLWTKDNCTAGRRTLIMDSIGKNYEVDPETVGMFAGVTDINSKNAYCDDILSYKGIIGVVKYGIYENSTDDNKGGHLGFYVFFKEEQFYRKDIVYWLGKGEIVGNIHEHKHLLDGGENQ